MLLAFNACAGNDPASGSGWAIAEPMSVARSEHPAVVWGDEIVVVGGLVETAVGRAAVTDSVEAYSPGDDSWRDLPPLPSPRHHAMAAVVEDRLFVIGGYSESGFDAVSEVWELGQSGWAPRSPLPRPVGAGAAVTLDGAVYVIGGSPSSGLLRYDPEADAWTELNAPLASREHLAAVAHDGQIWAIGGRWGGEELASTEIYTPDEDAWVGGPGMLEPRSGFGAAVLGDRIFVAGGEVFSPTVTLDTTEVLQPGGSFESHQSLPFGLHGNPLTAFDGSLFVLGGSERAGAVANSGETLELQLD